MTAVALDLLSECHRVGLGVRRYGDRLDLKAHKPPPAELMERLRAAKPELLATLPDEDCPSRRILTDAEADAQRARREPDVLAPWVDDGPHQPCPRCGWRVFWRPSMTRKPWRCGRCVPVPLTDYTDCTALPPMAGAP